MAFSELRRLEGFASSRSRGNSHSSYGSEYVLSFLVLGMRHTACLDCLELRGLVTLNPKP